MSKSQKKELSLIAVCAILFGAGLLTGNLWVYLLAYAVSGYSIFINAFYGITRGQMLDENFLMAIASAGALYCGEYPEAIAVLLFYRVGTFFEHYAVNSSRKSISSLMDLKADFATRLTEDGEEVCDPEELEIGDIILVKPGEKIPVDSTVVEGSSSLDTAALTGESIPVSVSQGDEVISGTVNLEGLLKLQVTKYFEDSTVSKILELVENAASRKANVEKFITKFAKYYTPIVVVLAILLFAVPTAIYGISTINVWLYRAMVFLVISCPCALVISVPLTLFAGVGSASRQGILVKGSNFLEVVSGLRTLALDKTGTITTGRFSITEVVLSDGENLEISKDELLRLAAACESRSNHPVAKTIAAASNGSGEEGSQVSPSEHSISDYKEISGRGCTCILDNTKIACGNSVLMEELGLTPIKSNSAATLVHVAIDGKYAGYIAVSDNIRPEAKDTISALKSLGVSRTIMLTGDREEIAVQIAESAGIQQYRSQLLPADKVSLVEEEIKSANGVVGFVGDGINDAPVLARADVGIAMGAFGSDAAIEAADVVIMADDISLLPTLVKISKKTMAICKENIIFALGVKFIILGLGAIGVASMWAAVFGDVGVSVISILNAMRALRFK